MVVDPKLMWNIEVLSVRKKTMSKVWKNKFASIAVWKQEIDDQKASILLLEKKKK